MNDLKVIFNDVNKVIEFGELGNYRPPKIYVDANELKYRREKAERGYQRDKPHKKIDLKCKKGTFLQKIQVRQAKLPSPQSYDPKQYQAEYKHRKISNLPNRCTLFQSLQNYHKKNAIPSSADFDLSKKKSVSLGKFDKSQNVNYLDAAVYNSAQQPGVGQYNVRSFSLTKLGKWDKSSRQQICINKQNNCPPPSTKYNPIFPGKNLFSQLNKSKLQIPLFGKQKRFNEYGKKDENKKLFYTGLSEWGMKTNYKKKDILTNLSNFNCYSKSVYYG